MTRTPRSDYFPSHELGIKTFREQVPIVGPKDDKSPTYRTLPREQGPADLVCRRAATTATPTSKADGPDKTLWGDEQLVWLKKSMLASDATYRVLVSPTPIVGPDDGYKRDNHTNHKGFRNEGDAFKAWGKEHGIWANTFLMCGDRHWQYHSIDPSGANEFSCGAFNDENSRKRTQGPATRKAPTPMRLSSSPVHLPQADRRVHHGRGRARQKRRESLDPFRVLR